MIALAAQPTLNELYGLIGQVPGYPLSVPQLVELARSSGASKRVVSFYDAFADDRVFDSEEDLAASTEQVEIMRREEPEMPQEIQVAPEEY